MIWVGVCIAAVYFYMIYVMLFAFFVGGSIGATLTHLHVRIKRNEEDLKKLLEIHKQYLAEDIIERIRTHSDYD